MDKGNIDLVLKAILVVGLFYVAIQLQHIANYLRAIAEVSGH